MYLGIPMYKTIGFDDSLVEVPYWGSHEKKSKKFIFADLEL